MTADRIRQALAAAASPEKAEVSRRFFKTGPEYSAGDHFIGVPVPEQRKIAKRFSGRSLTDTGTLLQSPIHEERLTALFLLVRSFEKGDAATRKQVVDLYLKNTAYVNNWDLVDSSAYHILGAWLLDKDRSILSQLAVSPHLWERRIAIVATEAFIRAGESKDTFEIAQLLLGDKHDLMHKAVGWMLREVGKHSGPEVLRGFLAAHASKMPRTALRYAIEHFSETERKAWLARPTR